jgi:hypothetical protein
MILELADGDGGRKSALNHAQFKAGHSRAGRIFYVNFLSRKKLPLP